MSTDGVGRRPRPFPGSRRRLPAVAGLAAAAVAVAVAGSASPALAAPAGMLDPAFGAGGLARLSLGRGASPSGLGVDAAGRVLVAGRVTVGGTIATLVARLTPAGAPDASFGNGGGAVIAQLGSQPGMAETASAVAVQADGNILVAGLSSDGRDFVERLLPGGTLDSSFATAGVYLTPYEPAVPPASLLIRPDGRIVLVGTAADAASATSSLMLVGLTGAGAVDPSFGTAGVAAAQAGQRSSELGATSMATGAALTPAGAIVVAAGASDTRGAPRGALARFTPAGTLDGAFGSAGISRIRTLRPAGLVVLGDGRVVAAGQAEDLAGVPVPALARFTATGAFDLSFGVRGQVISDLLGDLGRQGPAERPGVALGPALAADGSLIVDAVAQTSQPSPPRVLARFTAAGAIDCSYGTGGRAVLPVSTRVAGDAPPVIGPTGDALVAGDLGADPGIFVAAVAGGVGAGRGGPLVATGSAVHVGHGGVVLEGVVDPRCGAARARFDFGPGQSLARHTAFRAVDPRLGPQAVVAPLPRLARAGYRYRLVIRVGARTITGRSARFRAR